MHHEGQDSAGQAPFGLDEAAGHHDNQDDANAEGGARRQGLDQTMHGCRRKGYWVSARIWGDWVECFHNRPSIPNPSTESYSNGKTRDDAMGDETPRPHRDDAFNPEQLMHELEDFLRQERERGS